jgi:hypothetical protein
MQIADSKSYIISYSGLLENDPKSRLDVYNSTHVSSTAPPYFPNRAI